jgi:microcystin-dependent protein
MSDPFLAEIRIFPFGFAPRNWMMCNGQIIPIQQNAALFSLIGTYFGGNGTSNFALPDFEGSVPVCVGTGNGLQEYDIGQFGGGQTFTLQDSESPVHNHLVNATNVAGTAANPSNLIYAQGQLVNGSNKTQLNLYAPATPATTLAPGAIGLSGSGQPHNNMMPTLTLNFCICVSGIFPPRS